MGEYYVKPQDNRGAEIPFLLGREEEVADISRMLAKTVVGSEHFSLIDGPPGSGKTSLLNAAIQQAIALGFTVITCNCLYRGHSGSVRTSGCWTPVPQSEQSWSLGDGLGGTIRKLLARSPVLVALDDLHLMNRDELCALSGLTEIFRTEPLMWLVARRSDNRPIAHDHLFGKSGPSLDLRVRLDHLSTAAVSTFTHDFVRAPVDASLRNLMATTEGDPLLVAELLDGLKREEALVDHDGSIGVRSDRLPSTIIRAVDDRIHLLCAQDRHRVQVGAVLGRQFGFGAWAEKLDINPVALLSTLELAISLNILRSRRATVEFTSELLWRAVVELVPGPALAALGRVRPLVSAPATELVSYQLTAIEQEIVQLVSEGLTNQQIGRRLSRSPHTVNYHLRKLFRKLRVESRSALVAWAKGYGPVISSIEG